MTSLARPGLLAILLASICAFAVAGPAAAKTPFSRADPNRDGVVTYAEAERVMPRLKEIQYSKADSNRDGVIDKGEYPMLDSFYGYIVDQ